MNSPSRLPRLRAFFRDHLALFLPILIALILLGSFPILLRFPQLVENFYTRHFYAQLTKMLSPLSAALPFSLSELSLYFGIFTALVWGIRGIWRRRIGRTLLALATGLAILVLWFYFAWGLNYFRPRVEQQLHLVEFQPDSLALRENFLWSIANANAAYQTIPPWSLKELDREIDRRYVEVMTELELPAISGRWPPKFLLLPALLDYTLTSGIFGPFFHEVHLNSHLLPVELPFVLAHEKAHALGFARESEASFLAALVCFQSPIAAVRYSACFSVLSSARARYFYFADADSLLRRVRPEVMADYTAVKARIEKYRGPISAFSERSYDFYLRANQVEGGMENYADIVDLLIRWRKSYPDRVIILRR